ncbi:hypothetical protein A7K73_07920 [Candidatus Methylacidiphilum fumarolicum]|uniref:Uncharacterized protein n=2 Tax=Candidatus Methylacidiphilum fumarolicum TaxID=591154 RepID=I0K0M2_METFB|nr:hypothetical protein [Candidatus Methylacidiphilum fumarolicum]TFE68117.1 hypothetical protein A7K73_07920 [Candidatus Methylacidiphilum fumarolicum]TFE76922.1 hypothetical protein A7D33_07460 [Candidatus Methylacidiphilum fumarolicum]CAI9085749.1 conserved protein of unknown function [Candidatus Methylacidiphilum fumarolicum]CCG93041.1 conserved hypothetical protein [Methylacidiphilum fumariolicum SolV]
MEDESIQNSMNIKLHTLCALAVCFVLGCVSQKKTAMPIDPALIQNSYDYTKPYDVYDRSKPAYVLPVINTGWAKAKVDPKTGQWIGGHYVGTVIDPGHWATLEEAELSGKPYIRADNGQMIVPNPNEDNPPSKDKGVEIDLVSMKNRLEKMESTLAESIPPSEYKEAALMNALEKKSQSKKYSPTNFPSIVVGDPDMETIAQPSTFNVTKTSSFITVGEEEPAINKNMKNQDLKKHNSPLTTIEVPLGKPGQNFVVKTPNGGFVVIEFLPNRKVKVLYNGHTVEKIAPPDQDVVVISVPQ